MDWSAFPEALLVLPVWFGPPLLLLATATRRRATRIAFGTTLALGLAFLYAAAYGLAPVYDMPTQIEAFVLWGPTTLALTGAAAVTDRTPRSQTSAFLAGDWPEPTPSDWREGTVRPTPQRPKAHQLLATAVVVFSLCCASCACSPVLSKAVDIRYERPNPAFVLPLPNNLTLVSYDQGCGSQLCADSYLVGSPDQASPADLTQRLWTHLTTTKRWHRLDQETGCRETGWFLHHEFCVHIRAESVDPAVLDVWVEGG